MFCISGARKQVSIVAGEESSRSSSAGRKREGLKRQDTPIHPDIANPASPVTGLIRRPTVLKSLSATAQTGGETVRVFNQPTRKAISLHMCFCLCVTKICLTLCGVFFLLLCLLVCLFVFLFFFGGGGVIQKAQWARIQGRMFPDFQQPDKSNMSFDQVSLAPPSNPACSRSSSCDERLKSPAPRPLSHAVKTSRKTSQMRTLFQARQHNTENLAVSNHSFPLGGIR